MTDRGTRRGVPLPKRGTLESWATDGDVELLPAVLGDMWHLPLQDRKVLEETGLPKFNSLFIPELQGSEAPLLPPFYVLGRRQLGEHEHSERFDALCGCGYFGLDSSDFSVWISYPSDNDLLPVNSTISQFVYFLHMLGSAQQRYKGLADREMIARYTGVMERLSGRDELLMGVGDSFWKQMFEVWWG